MATNENPTYLDVQREVKRLYITKPDEPTDARYLKYREHVEAIRAALANATLLLAGGKLEEFFMQAQDEKRIKWQATRTYRLLEKIQVCLGEHILRFALVDEKEEQEEDK
jgi:hypothetical protein